MPTGGAEREGDDGEEPDQAVSVAGGALVVDADDDAAVCGALFRGLVFYLGREVPREPLLLVLRAFGGTVGWEGDGSPLQESDESITHQVQLPQRAHWHCDSPPTSPNRFWPESHFSGIETRWVF